MINGVAMQDIYIKLAKKINTDIIFTNEPMSKHTTFKIGGNADILITPKNVHQISDIVDICKRNNVPYLVMGNGSNILVRDGGIKGVVIKIGSAFSDIDIKGQTVKVQSGALLHKLCAATIEASLKGLEGLMGIPGTVGGAVYMNAGAYGYEIKDHLESIKVLKDGQIIDIDINDCHMGYRTSILKNEDMIVLEACFKLEKDDGTAEETAKELLERRRLKQPVEYPSAGSTFKRPKEGYASRLIDKSWLKGYKIGGACVSDKHAGFIINLGGATADDVLKLMEHVKDTVYENTGIMLEPEIRIVGHN